MEPIASPTRSDLLQKINEKKYHVNSDYLLREIAGEYAIIPVGTACQISNAVMVPNDIPLTPVQRLPKRYRCISLECFSAATYHFGSRCTGVRGI